MRAWLVPVVVLALALAASACNNGSSSNPTTPTTPKTTDTLTGTVQVGASSFQVFTVTTTGEVDVTLTTAGPPSTIVMGLAIGTTGTGSCVPIAAASSTQTAAGTSPQLSGILSPATYCLLVSALRSQTAAITWTATVTHP
jgi:hypothetical protein